MPQAIWKGNIRFGLVNIPVALYPAESPDDLNLDLLDKRDMGHVGYDRINRSTGRKVPPSEVVKGYEISDGRYVTVTDQDLKRAAPEATQTVDIVAFVEAKEIDPIYYDKPYYLAPVSKGDKAYALLREALKRSGRIGIARLVVRTRGYVAALYPLGKALVAQLLRYSHELRDPEPLHLPAAGKAAGISTKELDLADKLIEGMIESWKPEEFKDDYRDQLLTLIRKKAKSGKKAAAEEEEEEPVEKPSADVVDLMALLKQSVAKKGKGGAATTAAPAKRKARPTAAKRPSAAKRAAGSSRTSRSRS